MAKTFKSIETTYEVKGLWFDRANFKPQDFKLTVPSKSEAVIKKLVAESKGCAKADVRIDEITPHTVTKAVRVNASLAEILDACRKAGITVEDVNADADADETENA